MNWMGGYGHMGYMWFWWLLGVLLLAAIIWIFSRAMAHGTRPIKPAQESPEQILKRRYAAGEIDREEFTSLLQDLRI
ncbi:MAG: SHOCT domain-containing protein [Deltaproteobacteria bacterium]|nr:SHOCT domain-containing protein [Deltaproteobacteria bacterium]